MYNLDALERTRAGLLETGYDLYGCSDFAPFYIARLLGGELSRKHNDHCDITLKGLRIEVKFSNSIQYIRAGQAKVRDYFRWGHLRGVNGTKHGYVDLVVLAGRHDDKWFFWTIPFDRVASQTVESSIPGTRANNTPCWIDRYFTGNEVNLYNSFFPS